MQLTHGTRLWVAGLIQAFFAGVGGTLGANIILDVGDFTKQLELGAILGVIGLIQYLAKKPLPDIEDPNWSPAASPIKQMIRGTGDGAAE